MKERKTKVTLWVDDAVRITTCYSSFKGSIADWKECFYEIWRYQMTWRFAYEIGVYETRGRDLVVTVLAKKSYKNNAVQMMESIGYENIKVEDESVGITSLIDEDSPVLENVITVVDE